MSFKITEHSYPTFKRVFEIIFLNTKMVHSPKTWTVASPIDFANALEKKSMTLARRGLQEALRDSVLSLKDYPPSNLKAIEEALQKENLPGLDWLNRIVENTVAKVLKRGRIKSLDEYYTVKEIVTDQSPEITEAQRNLLDVYLSAYEDKV